MNWRELGSVAVAGATLVLLIGAAASGKAAFDVRCQANLRSIYAMAQKYSADNDGCIVRMLTRKYNRGTFWCDRLRVYAADFRDFSCPANARRGARAFQEDDLLPPVYNLKDVSFGINYHISGADLRTAPIEKIGNLADPSYTVYFGDSNTARLSAAGKLWAKDWAPVHDNGMQAVMADGHVERFTQETLGTFGVVPGWKRDPASWKKWKRDLLKGGAR